jgi:hypothetical protein
MAYTYEELKGKSLADLQEIAKTLEGSDAVKGHSQMNKAHLLPALCKALNIDMHEHHVVVGINKVDMKAKIRDLKQKRAAALEAQDPAALKAVRRQIHRLNHQIRAHVSTAH